MIKKGPKRPEDASTDFKIKYDPGNGDGSNWKGEGDFPIEPPKEVCPNTNSNAMLIGPQTSVPTL